jgi:hypothetical protein
MKTIASKLLLAASLMHKNARSTRVHTSAYRLDHKMFNMLLLIIVWVP